MNERRRLACGCVLDYERCFDCRPGLHLDQETALAISLASAEVHEMIRERLRPDGIPTRCDQLLMSVAELAITSAMASVEAAGGSVALTDAVTLLGRARDRVADHVENVPFETTQYLRIPVVPCAKQLKVFGYAAGGYMTKCHFCGQVKDGLDKRAMSCRECAEKRYRRIILECVE